MKSLYVDSLPQRTAELVLERIRHYLANITSVTALMVGYDQQSLEYLLSKVDKVVVVTSTRLPLRSNMTVIKSSFDRLNSNTEIKYNFILCTEFNVSGGMFYYHRFVNVLEAMLQVGGSAIIHTHISGITGATKMRILALLCQQKGLSVTLYFSRMDSHHSCLYMHKPSQV